MHSQSPRSRRRTLTTAITMAVVLSCAAVLLAAGAAALTGGGNGSASAGIPPQPHVVGIDDGLIETGDSISPFDDDLPAIALLDPALREAVQRAARDATADGVPFVVTSGWRSAAYQQSLFDEAVLDYGSVEEASRLVSTPDRSRHVTGDAVDIGYTDANSWLSQHGTDYGLCQTYSNEMWHFELLTTPGGVCPPQLVDASVR